MSVSSLLAAFSFYICSCACLQPSPDSSAPKHAVKASASMWREEIENYPQREGTLTPYSTHPPSTPVASEHSVMPLDFTAVNSPTPLLRTQTAPVRIHPPVNERHPPVVSVADHGETRWMTLPPPSAREIHSLNRQINKTRDRSIRSSISSAAQDTPTGPALSVPLAIENMVVGQQELQRGRYREGVLDDMDAPLRPGVVRGYTAPVRVRLGRRSTKGSGRSGASEEGARMNNFLARGDDGRGTEMTQLKSP